MPSYLGEWWRGEECGATTCFSLTQDLVTHLTVNLIPSLSILSPGRRGVGWGGGDQVHRARCSAKLDDRVFTPLLPLWIGGWWRRGEMCVWWWGCCTSSRWEDPPSEHLDTSPCTVTSYTPSQMLGHTFSFSGCSTFFFCCTIHIDICMLCWNLQHVSSMYKVLSAFSG